MSLQRQRTKEKNDAKKDNFLRYPSKSSGRNPWKEFHGLPVYNSKLAQKSAHAFRQGSRRRAPKSLVRTRTRSKTNPSITLASGVAAACPRDVFGAAYNRTRIRNSAEESFYLIFPRPPHPFHHCRRSLQNTGYETPFSSTNQQAMCPERP